MITPLIFSVLLLILAGAIWYMFADLDNRMYGNVISGLFATLLSGLFALWLFQGNVQEITTDGTVQITDGGLGWFFMLVFVSLLLITGMLGYDAWLEHMTPREDADYGTEG
ncbi:MAG: hypothetical protein WC262_07280 [Bacteroidales bacterium]